MLNATGQQKLGVIKRKTNMSTLEELGLNRGLTKDGGSSVDAVSKSLDTNIPVDAGDNFNAQQVITGTVITSCIVQASGGPNRVELAPYFTSKVGLAPTYKYNGDCLVAYKDNTVVVLINKDGIQGVENSGFLLYANKYFYYGFDSLGNNLLQPQIFTGKINTDGSVVGLPIGWTCTYNSAGWYTITHNLNHVTYRVNVTAINFPTRVAVSNITANTFDVYFEEDTYDGTGLHTGVQGVDTAFMFSFFNMLP